MSDELEIIGAASIGAVASDVNGDGYLNGPCPNCRTELVGQHCSNCGQSAKDMQRPFLSLFLGIMEDVFSLDGRLARTIPALLFRPGHMTRAYLDGKRARYVPPFRMFLIASVVFFLVLFGIFEQQDFWEGDDLSVGAAGAAITGLSDLTVGGIEVSDIEGFEDIFDDDGEFDRVAAETFASKLAEEGAFEDGDATPERFVERLEAASNRTVSRGELFAVLQTWAPRLSFLLLPLYVVLLTLLHFWMRRVYIYDHVIVALHLQTYLYAAATLAMLFAALSPGWAWGIFGVSIPIYLFLMLRKAYRTNWFFNLIRLFIILNASFIGMILLIVAVSLAGANELGVLDWDDLDNAWSSFENGVAEGFSEGEGSQAGPDIPEPPSQPGGD